ncbi:hypothetical protein E6C27_scaffold46581G00010 [Cucumis melo var. makuwa]|uniref:Uncharacterized protein n=1 Tax=Cucumis melo var. makuwa TaxID=1194695 RepID=A0A5A7T3N6_CUCMM|nr:hypothetical protein E6C27_scaffold46581G00010 [Cucumis melo var. makuwa]
MVMEMYCGLLLFINSNRSVVNNSEEDSNHPAQHLSSRRRNHYLAQARTTPEDQQQSGPLASLPVASSDSGSLSHRKRGQSANSLRGHSRKQQGHIQRQREFRKRIWAHVAVFYSYERVWLWLDRRRQKSPSSLSVYEIEGFTFSNLRGAKREPTLFKEIRKDKRRRIKSSFYVKRRSAGSKNLSLSELGGAFAFLRKKDSVPAPSIEGKAEAKSARETPPETSVSVP